MNRLANRQSEDKQSRIMLLKTITLIVSLILTKPVMVVSQEREIYLSMQQFDRTIDHAHAQCASIDLEFSQNFSHCLEDKMKGIYIDSSTIHSLAEK